MKKIVYCETCGKALYRYPCNIKAHVFCSRQCAKGYLSTKMTSMNELFNPDRMTVEVRTKLHKAHTGKGEGKSYAKTFGRHTHRIMAEQLLGRALKKGEVVHHIDGDRRNNDPFNLMVFKSQADHALWHKNERIDPSKNYE